MEKEFNTKESIALIERMIEATRDHYEKGAGTVFLIWGYICFAVSLAVLILVYRFEMYWAVWLWWAIPVLGFPISFIYNRGKKEAVKTHISKFIHYIWLVTGVMATAIPIICSIGKIYTLIPTLEIMILGMATCITGLVIKSNVIKFSGIIAAAISLVMLFNYNGTVLMFYDIVAFIIAIVVAMIIPGHILNRRKDV